MESQYDRAKQMGDQVKLEVVGDLRSSQGYSAYMRMVLTSLVEHTRPGGLQIRVTDRLKDRVKVSLPAEVDAWYKKMEAESFVPDVRLFIEPAQYLYFDDDIPTVSLIHWETDRICNTDRNNNPKLNLVSQLNQCKAVVVCGRDVKTALEASGVNTMIAVAPGPIFVPDSNKQPLPIEGISVKNGESYKTDRLVIGYMAQWSPRKNIRTFIEDCVVAFDKTQAVILLKTYGTGMPGEGEKIVESCRRIRDEVRKMNAPEMVIITEKLSDIEVKRFFRCVDIYYAPSKGEGFSVPLSLASVNGCYPIAPLYGGHREYLDGRCLVDGTFEPVSGMGAYEWDQMWFCINRRAAIQKLQDVAALTQKQRREICEAIKRRALRDAGAEAFSIRLLETLEVARSTTKPQRSMVARASRVYAGPEEDLPTRKEAEEEERSLVTEETEGRGSDPEIDGSPTKDWIDRD